MHASPEIGGAVYSMDRQKLGTVTEIVGDFFKVDEYWLSARNVLDGTSDRLRMTFDLGSLDGHKVNESRVRGA